jgi:UDP-N-acetylmuramate: L-alanyl-gamma-D-glutamyl-meso-diaminopimelate ligase
VVAERFIAGHHSIVVAGTHGKTTTSAMLAWVLDHAGRAPGFLVGGLPRNFSRPYRLAHGGAFVIEGDEYDTAFFDKGPKFMHYRPDTAVIGTVEFDHADIYRDLVEVRKVFTWFTNIVPRRGLVVRHEDCPTTREVTAKALSRVEGYGIEAGEWRAVDLGVDSEGTHFRILRPEGQFAKAFLPMFGEYNVRNALSVTAAAAEQGLSPEEIVSGLAAFQGVSRRLEVRGEVDGITILDDFAHHPTAIAATLTAVRARLPGSRIWAVLEPRSWSLRRNVFQDRLAQAFEAADEIVIAEVYGAEAIPPAERLDPERLVAEIGAGGRRARFLPGVDAIVAVLTEECRRADAIVILSNGAFGGIHEKLLEALEARHRTLF